MKITVFKIALVAIILASTFSCSKSSGKDDENKATFVEFTIDVSTGPLATNGGSLVTGGALIARTSTGDFIAVTPVCSNEAAHVPTNYDTANNRFVCPTHGEQYNSLGVIVAGSGTKNLTKYNTELIGTLLMVYP